MSRKSIDSAQVALQGGRRDDVVFVHAQGFHQDARHPRMNLSEWCHGSAFSLQVVLRIEECAPPGLRGAGSSGVERARGGCGRPMA